MEQYWSVWHMGVGKNLLLSILMGWTSIYQLFWGSLDARVLTNSHITESATCHFSNRRMSYSSCSCLRGWSHHLQCCWSWLVVAAGFADFLILFVHLKTLETPLWSPHQDGKSFFLKENCRFWDRTTCFAEYAEKTWNILLTYFGTFTCRYL